MEPFIQFLLLMAVISLARYFMEKAQKKLSGSDGPPERAEPNQSGPYSGGQEQAYGRPGRSTKQDWLDEDDLDGPDGYDLDPYAEDYEPSSGGRGSQSSPGQTDDRDRRIPQPEREVYDPRRHGSGGRADRPQKSRSLGQSLGEILQEMMDAGSMIDGPGRTTRQPEASRPHPHRTEPEKNVTLPYDEPIPGQHSLPKSGSPQEQAPTQPATQSLEHPEMPEAKAAPADIIKYDYSDGYISRAEKKAKRKAKKITKLRPSNLKQAVLFSEILNPPRSARWPRSKR